MVSRHLIVKLYLWLLLTLTLSVAAAAVVVGLLSEHDFEQRARTWVLEEVRPVRDLVENLLRSGLDEQAIAGVLAPLRRSQRVTVHLLSSSGRPVLGSAPIPGGAHGGGEDFAALLRRVGAGEEVVSWQERGQPVIALPVRLHTGEPGVLYLTGQNRWRDRRRFPWGMAAGVLAVLGVLWLLSWPLAAHLARPLQRMARVSDALGAGDLSVRIAPRDIQHRHARRARRDEIGRLAQSFNRMAENLQSLVLGHKQLLADISHELRSPLARLRLALELARGAKPEARAGYLDSMERQADAMDALIGELLLYARLEASPTDLHAESVALAPLVAEAIAAVQPDAEVRQVALHSELSADVPAVRVERRLLMRALGNALRNAVAYSPAGGTVQVLLRAEAERILLTVRDDGPGVAPDQLERIFEPFVRTDTARSRATGGVGLGLSIVRRCMAAHGGGAYAEPADPGAASGGGLAVTLWLPRPD